MDFPGGLPAVEGVVGRLRGTEFAREITRLASRIIDGRLGILGYDLETGPEIDWRRDYAHGGTSGTAYFRFIPYLDFTRVGDHKVIWELNRHQHLVLLAQAFLFTGRREYFERIAHDLETWFDANPYGRGINWASALEVAFRSLSWLWVYHLVGRNMSPELRREFTSRLYLHGCYLENNLSVYFSPNTHLLGEAVALHALGALLPGFPRARTWERIGARITRAELDRQVHEDGSHFEHSTYYHVYALDMFLFHYLAARRPADFVPRLARMAGYLDALMGPGRELPFFGDDDGGRFFHPYGDRARFGRATLATCAVLLDRPAWNPQREDLYEQAGWWLGEEAWRGGSAARTGQSRFFPQSGIAVMECGDVHIAADAGTFGFGSAGHSHSDALSFVARRGEEEILADSGTFTYMDRRWRDWFRGSAAHNTIRVDELDQAAPSKPFGWSGRPEVQVLQWTTARESDFLDASCTFAGYRLRRRILFLKPGLLIALDEIGGPPGERLVEQFWHFGTTEPAGRLKTSAAGALEEGGEHGWRSTVYGRKTPAPVLRVVERMLLPGVLATALDLSAAPRIQGITVERDGDDYVARISGDPAVVVRFGAGAPKFESGGGAWECHF